MPTTKTTTPAVEEFDFDSWDEAAEDKAIAEAAKAQDVRYIIIEGKTFVAKFPDGTILKAPLKISFDAISAIQESNEDQVEQVKAILHLLGQDGDAELLGHQNLISVIIFAEKYFRVFQRIAGASLGE